MAQIAHASMHESNILYASKSTLISVLKPAYIVLATFPILL